jgi:nucleoside-diphosphate-sugar epimerase
MDLTQLNHKKILITGATGLIGRTMIETLLEWNERNNGSIQIIALVRNREKAEKMFSGNPNLSFLVCDVCNIPISNMDISYMIHGASITSSKMFVEQPVETVMTALLGTKNILELARVNPVKSVVYLSSMEVYGYPQTEEHITEEHGTDLDPMTVRSGYPESKRMCENLCASYGKEYGMPTKVVRLTQTFGPGVPYADGRVFAEFARCAIEKKDIVLKTKGETKRNYLYTKDAAEAILTVLLKGENGAAYNAANEETFCSIYEMAQLVAQQCVNGEIKVRIEEKDISQYGYAPVLKMNLDAAKLRALGWKPQYNLKQMYDAMIMDMKTMERI